MTREAGSKNVKVDPEWLPALRSHALRSLLRDDRTPYAWKRRHTGAAISMRCDVGVRRPLSVSRRNTTTDPDRWLATRSQRPLAIEGEVPRPVSAGGDDLLGREQPGPRRRCGTRRCCCAHDWTHTGCGRSARREYAPESFPRRVPAGRVAMLWATSARRCPDRSAAPTRRSSALRYVAEGSVG